MRISLVLLLVMLVGCRSTSYKLWKLEQEDPEILAEYCAETYPIYLPEPIFREGEPVILIDTFWADCDSVAKSILDSNPGISEELFLKMLKDHHIAVYSQMRIDTSFQPYLDSARLKQMELANERLRLEVVSKDNEISKRRGSGDTWRWVSIGLGVMFLILMVFVLRMKKII